MPKRVIRLVDSVMSEMPFEVLIILLCILTGLPMALGVLPQPNSLIATLPSWTIKCWGGLLSVGGITALIGLIMSHLIARRRFVEGMYLEAGGLLVIGSGALVFGLCIVVAVGWPAVFSISVYCIMAAACFFRYRTIRRTISKMREAIVLERKHLDGD